MEYNVLIPRSGDRLTANPGECGGIGALAALPELEASDELDRCLPPPTTPNGESASVRRCELARKHIAHAGALVCRPHTHTRMQMSAHAQSKRGDTVS